MSIRSNEIEENLAPFPQGKNVRITIAGLAVCEFKEDTRIPSVIHFLRHVPHHKLKINVRRRQVGSASTQDFFSDEIPNSAKGIEIIPSSSTRPATHIHNPQNDEFELDETINLSNTHKTRFRRNPNRAITMNLSNRAFYTKRKTRDKYIAFIIDDIQPSYTPTEIGEIIGAYMNVSGIIRINKVEANGNVTLLKECPIIDGGNPYEYEIEFTNHCESIDTEDCELAIGGRGSDVRFLYDIETPPKSDVSKVILLKVELDEIGNLVITPNVAACLPAPVEPCDSCS